MSYHIIQSDTNNVPAVKSKIVGSINSDAGQKVESAEQRISIRQIVNLLNYINFQDEAITVNLRNTRFDNIVSLQAKPQPCVGDEIFCEWAEPSEAERKLFQYVFDSINLINNNKKLIFQPKVIDIGGSGLRLSFTKPYYPVRYETITNHPCKGLTAQLIQHGTIFKGVLTDFSTNSFNVKITLEPPQTSQWLNPDANVDVLFSNGKEIFYTGECSVTEALIDKLTLGVRLCPNSREINRFKPKKFRSQRESIIPTPNVMFMHPMTRKVIELKVVDISGSGFSVEGGVYSTMLFPGMIIPNIKLSFTKRFNLILKAQVIYNQNSALIDNATMEKIGMTIIDIDSESHNNLMGILHQTQDENSYINNNINLDELWDFFFESGFIYPQKYEYLKEHKEAIKRTFKIIYSRGGNIARHFVFQKQGYINSHMSTIRYYDRSWLIHHHAARRSSLNAGGLSVLNQIGRFINDSHRLYSAKMDYVFCYFRHDNKFPNRVFGGASRIINNQKACSLDSFAYFHMHSDYQYKMVPIGWELVGSDEYDLAELEAFYKKCSNGLMIKALELYPTNNDLKEISLEFEKIGLKRKRLIFSLKFNEVLKAIIIINKTDIGLNLSDLTNSTTVYVLDPSKLPIRILHQSIATLINNHSMQESPILLYPVDYLKARNFPLERTYDLWILNMNSTDQYFRYLTRLLRFVQS